MYESINGNVSVRGRVRPNRIIDGIWKPSADWQHNDVLYSWGSIAARQLTQLGANYRVNGMYMEYKNTGSPDETVSPPIFDRSGGISYFNDLSTSPNVDFLRVPLTAVSLDNSDPNTFNDVNRMTFFAMSQGVVGANGKPFGPSYNSIIYGGALVAIVDLADRTQDVVFSRFYLEPVSQMEALANQACGLEWVIALT